MKETIKELFYGNIIPCEKSISSPEMKALTKSLWEQRKRLTISLNEEQLKLLEKYDDLQGELSSLTNEEFFIDGFTLGANIIKDILE